MHRKGVEIGKRPKNVEYSALQPLHVFESVRAVQQRNGLCFPVEEEGCLVHRKRARISKLNVKGSRNSYINLAISHELHKYVNCRQPRETTPRALIFSLETKEKRRGNRDLLRER
jgi:hypothetical protein